MAFLHLSETPQPRHQLVSIDAHDPAVLGWVFAVDSSKDGLCIIEIFSCELVACIREDLCLVWHCQFVSLCVNCNESHLLALSTGDFDGFATAGMLCKMRW